MVWKMRPDLASSPLASAAEGSTYGLERRAVETPTSGSEGPRSTALASRPSREIETGYSPPRPGRTWRASLRSAVLLGGSVSIGTGVALGWFGVGPAVLFAVGLATTQVLGQSFHQNRLGQDVMGGIAVGDLQRALAAAETALAESPSGAMRTLAAANLASVLMQMDRIVDGTRTLDSFAPRWPHVPISTVLWDNNRAFATLVSDRDGQLADELLDDAEQRLERAGPKGFGGIHNWRKISAAVAGTRAMQCLAVGDPRAALLSLERSRSLEDSVGMPFRTAERELCRAEALRQLGRKDEAILAAMSLHDVALTRRQSAQLNAIEARLGMPPRAIQPVGPDDDARS